MPWPVLRTGAPRTRPSVGFMQIGTHTAVTELLCDLGQDRGLFTFKVIVNSMAEFSSGSALRRELDVDDGAGDGDDPAVLQFILCHGHDFGFSWCVVFTAIQ